MSAKTRNLLGSAIFSAFALASHGAYASTTTLQYQGAAYPSYVSGKISYADGAGGYPDFTDKGVGVGGFNMKNTSTNQSLIAWCVDIFDWLNTTSALNYSNNNPNSINNFDKLQQLVNQSYSKVNNATTSAAFQLAVWEVVNETAGATSFSLGGGRFTATTSSHNMAFSNAVALANDWLSLDEAVTGNYKVDYYFYGDMPNQTTQNLISMSPVPLPAAGWLMLSALGMGGWLTKRRAGRAAAGQA